MVSSDIVAQIKKGGKYNRVNERSINNVAIIMSDRVGVEGVKKKLHQIWGAYYTSLPKYNKVLEKVQSGKLEVKDILRIHSSTSERSKIEKDFFRYIFKYISSSDTVLDIGSGLNPLFFTKYPDRFNRYISYDIDISQQQFLASFFELKKIKNMSAFVADATLDSFDMCDVVLALKLLPVLDQIDSDLCDDFLKNLKCSKLIVSFPTKSLGGREKGMLDNYSSTYPKRIESLGYSQIGEMAFANELVYVFQSNMKFVK